MTTATTTEVITTEMPVYVDKARNEHRGMVMCHMLADTLEELHRMADALGLKREWFQPLSTPHYDIPQTVRNHAIEFGAIEIDRRQTVAIIRRLRNVKAAGINDD
jgi:hypothetical protein